jgi:hypothetical protein
MARRSAGFVSKKPHRKSRGGCLTCKRKKVKVRPAWYSKRKHVTIQTSVTKLCLCVDIARYDNWPANILMTRRRDHLHLTQMFPPARSPRPLQFFHHPRKLTSTTPLVKFQIGSFQSPMHMPATLRLTNASLYITTKHRPGRRLPYAEMQPPTAYIVNACHK